MDKLAQPHTICIDRQTHDGDCGLNIKAEAQANVGRTNDLNELRGLQHIAGLKQYPWPPSPPTQN